jgi:hypothetical protein
LHSRASSALLGRDRIDLVGGHEVGEDGVEVEGSADGFGLSDADGRFATVPGRAPHAPARPARAAFQLSDEFAVPHCRTHRRAL